MTGSTYATRGRACPLSTAAAVHVALLGFVAVLNVIALLADQVAWWNVYGLPLVMVPAFVIWLYEARTNVDGIGYRHRLPRSAVFWGWFVPVANLYLPVRFVLDVWWARVPEGRRGGPTARVLVWWACWCLVWIAVALRWATAGLVFLVLAEVALISVVWGVAADAANPGRPRWSPEKFTRGKR